MTDLLEQHILRTANPIDDSDWRDVRRRARWRRVRTTALPTLRPRRRWRVLAVAAAAVAAIVATPAFGIGSRIVDLIEGTPAPPQVRAYFALSNQRFVTNRQLLDHLLANTGPAGQTLEDKFPVVVPDQAQGVAAIESRDGSIYLWAAPTSDGRQCWLVQAGADRTTGRPWGVGSCDESQVTRAMLPDPFWTSERPNVMIVHVRVYSRAITTVELEVSGAPPVTLPVASGHALGTVPKDATITAYVGRDARSKVVARESGE
jgi:hypothetical protein